MPYKLSLIISLALVRPLLIVKDLIVMMLMNIDDEIDDVDDEIDDVNEC